MPKQPANGPDDNRADGILLMAIARSSLRDDNKPGMLMTLRMAAIFAVLAAADPGCLAVCRAAEIPRAANAPAPLPPEESQKLFRLPAGFRIELVASEPHLADPVAMAFDAHGRILVREIHGYNLEGNLDIVELNKTGVLDFCAPIKSMLCMWLHCHTGTWHAIRTLQPRARR